MLFEFLVEIRESEFVREAELLEVVGVLGFHRFDFVGMGRFEFADLFGMCFFDSGEFVAELRLNFKYFSLMGLRLALEFLFQLLDACSRIG